MIKECMADNKPYKNVSISEYLFPQHSDSLRLKYNERNKLLSSIFVNVQKGNKSVCNS